MSHDRQLDLSVFKSVTDLKTVTRQKVSWPRIVEVLRDPPVRKRKEACKLWKLARFGDKPNANGSLRHNANVTAIDGVECDYDREEVQPAEAARRLRAAGIKAAIYTSPSHTPEKPRWRVLAPLSKTHRPEERAALVSKINGALGGILNGESWTLSQTYYVGKVEASDV